MPFGSFARRAKIQSLDDIDLLVILCDRGVRVSVYRSMPITRRVESRRVKVAARRVLLKIGLGYQDRPAFCR